MPPLRTMPAAKPVKTERTHEENQERAYIAASRRSDRSLEARVESARRASEIHKRRTGRSLRVTEQDVVNEEMYEEEDDDLPMQYRRLTAHLQTTNADFDRRLAAYLTHHVAMRTALGAAVSDNYVHPQYTNAPQFANQMSQFAQPQYSNPMLPPQTANRSPQSFRQSPYTMPNQQGYRQNLHARAASIAAPQELQGHQQNPPPSPVVAIKSEDRRMSLPAHGIPTVSQSHAQTSPQASSPSGMSRTSSSVSLANLKHEAAQQGAAKSGAQQSSPGQNGAAQHQHTRPQMKIPNFPSPFSMPFGMDSMGNYSNMPPFTTTLPTESQQLLGPHLDANDPFTAMLLGNQEYRPQQSFYSYNPNASSKGKGFNPPLYDGMNQTLAPGMLDTSMPEHGSYNTPLSATDSAITPQSGFGGFGFDPSYNDVSKSLSTSGLTTPGEHDWANLIDANFWEEACSQQA